MRNARGDGRADVPGVVWIGLAFGVGVAVLAALAALGGGLSLPALFVALAAVMMILALSALWQSLRSAFGGGPEAFGSTGLGLPERGALLEEKGHLLRAIKDIAFEREVGKISDEDFARLDRAYRQRAKEVLWQLDQDLAPYLEKAERLVAIELGGEESPYRGGEIRKRTKGKKGREKRSSGVECDSCGTRNDLDAEHCKECGARLKPVACPSCGTENDPDAKFCKRCAAPLAEETPSAGASVSTAGSVAPVASAAGSGSEPVAVSGSDADSAAGSGSGSEAVAVAAAGSDGGSEADADAEAVAVAGSDADSDSDSDSDSDTDSDSDSDSDSDTDADADTDADEGRSR